MNKYGSTQEDTQDTCNEQEMAEQEQAIRALCKALMRSTLVNELG